MKILLAFALFAFTSFGMADQTPTISNYETPGNLAATTKPTCFPVAKANNKLTPADLYGDLGACLVANDYVDAAGLFALAGVYGRYDIKRVADESAHEAVGALQMEAIGGLSDDQTEKLQAAIDAETDKNSDSLKQLCKTITAIGMPDYYPAYMIQHGMNAVMSSMSGKEKTDDGLIKSFDSKAAWADALNSYLHCPTQ